ncbi:hypothetical protein CFN78_00290 [Amycolatopsis antarctica]|uniref:Secreted protein n=1 Tax=Amycolatopsis antarctica TaxID=1854586 RepID=A0A263D887_9PSEU|nr:hypothetical protein [Amycolatopsis antarctica]OZM74722.1 hypothetical protein CFN78_00290 [Amycolatopsis antarctica]
MTSTATRQAGPVSQPAPPGPDAERDQGRSGLGWLLALPRNAVRRLVRSAGNTPGRLSVIALGLVVLALLTALVGTFAVQGKQDTIDGLVDHREPLAAAAQQVYRSLSDADATSASAFLSTGSEPAELRDRYEVDIAQAGAALAKAASDSEGAESSERVDTLSRQIPVYTGLIETARANNRQGFPAGASYLREASELMRSQILPAAQDLYRIDTERLSQEQDDATSFPFFTTLLVLGLLAALIATQIYLRRKTNRVINVGLMVASIATGVAILWSGTALTVQTVLVGNGATEGTERADVLVRARIAALQARADETLTLVARGDGGRYEKDFVALGQTLAGPDGNGGLLREARDGAQPEMTRFSDAATADARAWFAAHTEVRALDDSGDYQGAVSLAIDGARQDGTATAFYRLDGNLAQGIGVTRQAFLDDTVGSSRALTLLAPGFAVLMVVAALGVTLGIRERLREYR